MGSLRTPLTIDTTHVICIKKGGRGTVKILSTIENIMTGRHLRRRQDLMAEHLAGKAADKILDGIMSKDNPR